MVVRLRPDETGMLARDTGARPWHLTEVTLLAGDGLTVEEVRDRVAERLAYVPRFRQRVAESLTGDAWLDDTAFDLDAHVRAVPLRPRATLAEVQGFVAELLHAPLSRHHPRWEIGVVESVQGRRSALITRVHPAWVDGVDHVHLLQELLDDVENPDAPVPGPWTPQPEPTAPEETVQDLVGALRDPARLLGGLGGALGRLGARGNAQLVAARPRALHVAGTGAPLESLQRVADAFGCGLADVVLAMVAGGLHRRGQRDEPVALVPQPVDESGLTSALGFALEPATLALPVRAASALERLEHVVSLTRAWREAGHLVADERVAELPGFAAATMHALAARAAVAGRRHDVLVSRVPGPATPRFLGTRRVKATYPILGLTEPERLSVGVTSHAGQVWLGLTGTEPVAELATTIVDELQELLQHAKEA